MRISKHAACGTRHALGAATILSMAVLVSGCGDSSMSPSPLAIATLAVGGESFRVSLTSPQQLAAVRAIQAGGTARIPNGRIVGGTQVNAGWSWHIEDVEFVEVAIELCDGRPSDVERQGAAFGGGRYCPWSSTVVRVDER